MEIRHLRYFLAVAEELSFTRAAAALRIAQPPLSTQIRALESELGVELFDRSRRAIALTAAGQALIPEARRILTDIEQAVRIVQRAGDGTVGTLVVGFVPSAMHGALPHILRRYREEFPGVELSLHERAPDELLSLLHERRIDVALLYAPFYDDALHTQRVSTEELVAALPQHHQLAPSKVIDVCQLAPHPLILPIRHETPGLYSRIKRVLDECHVSFTVVQRDVWMIQTIIGLVAAEVGIAIVPSSAATLRTSEVVYRPLAQVMPAIEMTAAWRADATSPTLQGFADTIRDNALTIPFPPPAARYDA
jgi:DNA-binding transcriptional LysR family regulator